MPSARRAIRGPLGIAREYGMGIYYFDLRDGVPSRDRQGAEFATMSGAIKHSRVLAEQLRQDPGRKDAGRSIVVLDGSGTEIHRERV
jgi:hypothetical protein